MSFDNASIIKSILVQDTDALEIMLATYLDPNTEISVGSFRSSLLFVEFGPILWTLFCWQSPNTKLSLLGYAIISALACTKEKYASSLKVLDTLIEHGADIENITVQTSRGDKQIGSLEFLYSFVKYFAKRNADQLDKKIDRFENLTSHFIKLGADTTDVTQLLNNELEPDDQDTFSKRLMLLLSTRENLSAKSEFENTYDYEL